MKVQDIFLNMFDVTIVCCPCMVWPGLIPRPCMWAGYKARVCGPVTMRTSPLRNLKKNKKNSTMYIQHNSNVSSLVIDLMLNLMLLVFKYVQNFIKIYKKFKKVQKFHCITPEGNVTECVTKTGEKQIKYTLLKENLKVRMLQLSQGLSRQVTISIWACQGVIWAVVTKGLHK